MENVQLRRCSPDLNQPTGTQLDQQYKMGFKKRMNGFAEMIGSLLLRVCLKKSWIGWLLLCSGPVFDEGVG